MRLLRLVLVASAMILGLSACASAPEMKMTPAASVGAVGVRFSRGEAFMASAGDRGAVMLVPARYNDGSGKTLFVIAGYNRSSQPINFGTENVAISLDNGVQIPVYNFDSMRHGYKSDAASQRLVALVEAAANVFSARSVGKHEPRRGRAKMREAADLYDYQLHSIADNLAYKVRGAQRTILQTTTIDPQTYWAGWIVADQPLLSPGEVRQMTATVTFAGESHRFNLFLAPEGTPTPPQVSLPAVTRADGEEMLHGTPQTWLWDAPRAPPIASARVGCTTMIGLRSHCTAADGSTSPAWR